MSRKKQTPSIITLYREAKARHPGMLLVFRFGDFYELFAKDAETAAKLLGLTLTSRRDNGDVTAMAGFPHHALEANLRKLLEAGQRVAICEQVESSGNVQPNRIIVPAGETMDETTDAIEEAIGVMESSEAPKQPAKRKRTPKKTAAVPGLKDFAETTVDDDQRCTHCRRRLDRGDSAYRSTHGSVTDALFCSVVCWQGFVIDMRMKGSAA